MTYCSKNFSLSFAICLLVVACYAHEVLANDDDNSDKKHPLKVNIPNISAKPKPLKLFKFTAQHLDYYPDLSLISASGNVVFGNAQETIKADKVDYDKAHNTLKLHGNIAILGHGGKENFAVAEDMELQGSMKASVINKLKAKLANNPPLMMNALSKPAADEPKIVEAKNIEKPEEKPEAKNITESDGETLFDQLFAGITADIQPAPNPEELAKLSPAAGGDQMITPTTVSPAKEDKAVIGNVPLISLPEVSLPEAKISETKATNVKIDTQKIEPTAPVIPTVVAAPTVSIAASDIPAPAKKDPENSDIKKLISPMDDKSDDKISKPVGELPDIHAAMPVEKPAKKIVRKQPKIAEPVKKEDGEEPAEGLSPDSQKVLDKIAPKISQNFAPKYAKASAPVEVSREHEMQDLFKNNGAADATDPIPNEALANQAIKVERRKQPINTDSELEKAYDATNSGQSATAIETYKNILENNPSNTQALFGLATMYHRARQLDKARPLYAKLLAIDPQNRDGFNNFLVLLADEAPREALVELEKLETKNPSFGTIPAQMAVIYQKLGDMDKATDKMFRAVALAPENLAYRYNLAIMMDKQHNYEEAEKLYKQLVEAAERGEKIPGNLDTLKQRLTFISSGGR